MKDRHKSISICTLGRTLEMLNFDICFKKVVIANTTLKSPSKLMDDGIQDICEILVGLNCQR